MGQSDDQLGSNGENLTETARFYEHLVEESRRSVQEHKRTFDRTQSLFLRLMRYHLVFLGLVFAVVEFQEFGSSNEEQVALAFAIASQFLGIMILAVGHRSLGYHYVGFETPEFFQLWKDCESYEEGLEHLARHYDKLYEKNFRRLNKHHKYKFASYCLLAMGFGALTSITLL